VREQRFDEQSTFAAAFAWNWFAGVGYADDQTPTGGGVEHQPLADLVDGREYVSHILQAGPFGRLGDASLLPILPIVLLKGSIKTISSSNFLQAAAAGWGMAPAAA